MKFLNFLLKLFQFFSDFYSTNQTCEKDECILDIYLIKRINDKKIGWKAGYYDEFMGKKLQKAFNERLGTLYPRYKRAKISHPYKEYSQSFTPKKFYNVKSTQRIDQGWCNNSWAASTFGVISDKISKISGGNIVFNASNLLECEDTQWKCSANYLIRAWIYIKNGMWVICFIECRNSDFRAIFFLEHTSHAKIRNWKGVWRQSIVLLLYIKCWMTKLRFNEKFSVRDRCKASLI